MCAVKKQRKHEGGRLGEPECFNGRGLRGVALNQGSSFLLNPLDGLIAINNFSPALATNSKVALKKAASLSSKGIQLLLVSLAILSCGLNSPLIQLAAWIKMIPSELIATGSLSQAVENTFDGQHPCKMCEMASAFREMEEGQPSEESPLLPPTPSAPKKAMPLFCKAMDVRVWLPAPSSTCGDFHEPLCNRGSTRGEPLVPPPQVA